MKILVLNAGSSSIKYQLIDMTAKAGKSAENSTATPTATPIAKGIVERVGTADSFHKHGIDVDETVISVYLPNHKAAVKIILDTLIDPVHGVINSLDEIDGIGHRVVHGGDHFTASQPATDDVLADIAKWAKLAPLHNTAALAGINAVTELLPNPFQACVFDTAFHQTMPPKAYMYPLPYELYKSHQVRKYGFHGTSHRYIASRAAALLEKPLDDLKLITCHLGNGCSLAAVDGGQSVDTTMGFTPLDGLMMGTRSGSIDPAIVCYLIENLEKTPQEVSELLNNDSGLLGISGLSNDLRDVRAATEAGDERASLAYEMYSNSVKKHIGAFCFAMAGVHAVVLSAGVGENCDRMRRMIFEGLEPLGIKVDHDKNLLRGGERFISTDDSRIKILVIPTNEEMMIAQDTYDLMSAG